MRSDDYVNMYKINIKTLDNGRSFQQIEAMCSLYNSFVVVESEKHFHNKHPPLIMKSKTTIS